MPTTADYFAGLKTQQSLLAENLNTMGVAAAPDELLNTLVPKVLDIGGAICGEWTPAVNTAEFTAENLPFTPKNLYIQNLDMFTAPADPGNGLYYFGTFTGSLEMTQYAIFVHLCRASDRTVAYSRVTAAVNQQLGVLTALPGGITFNHAPIGQNNYVFKAGTTYRWVVTE